MPTRETSSFQEETAVNSRSPLRAVLDHVDSYEERGSGYRCICPAHDDRNPSLDVDEGDDKRALLKCRAGCSQSEVVAALKERGLSERDLFPNSGPRRYEARDYEIRDSSGRVVAIHERRDYPSGEKRFYWKHPTGEYSNKANKLSTKALPLYRSEEVKDWPRGADVVLVEGEKAADALNGRGIRALGTASGASSSPSPSALAVLDGFRLILWPDADPEGEKHMRRVGDRLQGVASSILWFEWQDAPCKGADAADHPTIKSGEGRGELVLS